VKALNIEVSFWCGFWSYTSGGFPG